MKMIKIVIYFLTLVLVGVVISYADMKSNYEYNKFIETFNSIDADFKFYNIKGNAYIDYDISKNEIIDICIEVVNNLGLEESDIKLDEKWNDKARQIYIESKSGNKNVSVVGIKKNDDECYIIVDILDNKVYKNIVDIYTVIENTLNKHSSNVDINMCISGEYSKKIQLNKYNDILYKILYNMNAEVVDKVENENFLSITAYSKILNESYLEYLGNKINLNIGMRYSEDDDKTFIYIATPIIKLDY